MLLTAKIRMYSSLKRKNNTSPILKNIMKYSYLLLLASPLVANSEERSGLLLNGGLSAVYTDNILNNSAELSDTAIIFTPNARYLSLVGKHQFSLNYDGNIAHYTKDSDLSYNEHSLSLDARLDHSHKLNTEFRIGFDKKIEEPGSTNTSTQDLLDYNQYKTKSALARLYYGQKSSIGQIVIDYDFAEYEYTNNNQSFRDLTRDKLGAIFYYRVAPKTRLIFQASATKYTYDDQLLASGLVFNQTSLRQLYTTGVEWNSTAKTTGIFRIGYQKQAFDDARFNDISGLSYNLNLIWKPSVYTRVTFGTKRETSESAQLNEGAFVSTSYSLNASHNITKLTKVSAQYSLNNDDIVSSTNRVDKRNVIKVEATHSLRKWLNISFNYKYQEKSSNIDQYNYDSNTIGISLKTFFK